jgi:eukaryotic-like serine/threonine-protein kinase
MLNTTALASGQVVAARYQLARPLAAGHDPTTWLARDATTEREVVLRFRASGDSTEGSRIRAFVRHAALLAPIASHADDDLAFDVFEYLPGGEIGRLRGRPWTLIARRLLAIADALAVLHEAGWVHGDVKSANVLLDADGLPHLADLGSARRIGATQPAGASPYSTSPERLDGAPAAPADDAYAFGVLLYELVSGHPPFYPDITPERVRNEIPPTLSGRPEPPAALRELVAQCLAKQPLARPASMRDLHARLEHVLETAAATVAPLPSAATPAPAWQPRPPADALPVQPQWRRSTTTGQTPQALRNEGFRRGLLVGAFVLALVAAGFTFFVLPGLVASRKAVERQPAADAPSAAVSPPPAPPPAVDYARLAEQKRLAEARREPLPGRLQLLEARDVASWGGASYAQVRSELAAGDTAMTARDFVAAMARFEATARGLDELEKRLLVVVAERRAAAQAAFDAGRAAEATDRYQAVLKVAPGDAAARP